jgi:hypothetical protein
VARVERDAGEKGGEGICCVYVLCAQPDKNRTVTSGARAFLMRGFDYAIEFAAAQQ